jgi:hypothetical protein
MRYFLYGFKRQGDANREGNSVTNAHMTQGS